MQERQFMRKDLKQSLISTSFYLLILTTFLPLPLAAMNDGEGRESVTRVLSRSIAKAGVGATLIWTGMQLEEYNASYSSQFPERDYHNGILLAEQMSTIVGLKLIASACYDLGLYAYTSWKRPSIRAQIETDAKGAKKNRGKQRVQVLEKQDPEKEVTRSLNYLTYGLDIASALLWIPQTVYTIQTHHRAGYYNIYTFYPRTDLVFQLDPYINVWTTSASLVNVFLSTRDLISQLRGNTPSASSPLRSFIKACSTTTSAKFFEEIMRQQMLVALRQGDFSQIGDYNVPLMILRYLYYLRIGDSVENFYKGCQMVYEERKHWFCLVDELADPVGAAEGPVVSQPKGTKPSNRSQRLKSPFTKGRSEELKNEGIFSREEALPSASTSGHNTSELSRSKPPKIKTRGVPGLDKQAVSQRSDPHSSSAAATTALSANDQHRQSVLSTIQDIRLRNSAKKNVMEKMYEAAARFKNGKIIPDGNKVTIHWKRGERDRSVSFELVHKQRNEKSSVLKGHKLKVTLDALEQIYLDGWDKENILAHLDGRFKLYNLPYQFLKVLWTDRRED